jgi:ADP-ribose pyrophosphatase
VPPRESLAMDEPAIALVALLNPAGEILLLLRDDKPGINYPGHWSLIGGHRDGEETIHETARRETLEEIGLDLPDLRRIATRRDEGGTGSLVAFFAGCIDQPAETLILTEGQRVQFHAPAALPAPMPAYVRAFLAEHLPRQRNPWTTAASRPLYDNPWIAVTEHRVLNPKRKPGIYGTVHFHNRALGVVPLFDDGSTLLVGQYRYPQRLYSWEIPEGGGKLADAPRDAAARELLEETGLVARHWRDILRMDLSNSVSDETALAYVAWDLEQRAAAPEETEDLALWRLSLLDAYRMARDGEIWDALSVAALLQLRLLAEDGKLPDDLIRLLPWRKL